MDNQPSLLKQVFAGAGAGLVGTVAIMAMRSFDQKYAPKTIPATRKDPGQFVVEKLKRAITGGADLTGNVEHAAVLGTHLGYGSTFGLLYGLLHLGRGKDARSPLVYGPMLGLFAWAVSYFGLLPASKLAKPAWKQPYPQVAGAIFRHAAFGVVTAAAYQVITDAF